MAKPATAVMVSCARGPRIFLSVGEVSGDIVASKLIGALRAEEPRAVVEGLGGRRMADAGAMLVASAEQIGAVGITEGLAMAPSVAGIFLKTTRHCRARRPDVALLIANDVFNVLLGRWLRAKGIQTISLFPPQTWIWGAAATTIARSFDLVLASFPEEVECYRRAGVATEFVGHYLADVLAPATCGDRAAARQALGLLSAAPVVAILPGSRQSEIARLLPVLLAAGDLIRRRVPAAQLVAALHDPAGGALRTTEGHPVTLAGDSHTAMRAADVMISCSGTATLEAALIGVPMAVAYKTSWTTYAVVRAAIAAGLIRDETVALPNLLLGRPLVPQFVQRHVTAPALAEAALALMSDDMRRREMRAGFEEIRPRVGRPGTLRTVARILLERAAR